jgi:EAL domain-containing protein (putative c-di-GMP-specific phosphodiesterase class I)
MAMYRAKEAGRATCAVYANDMARDLEERVEIQGRLKRAIETHALRLFYQPQVSAVRGEVEGLEALLRWTDPVLGEVSPARFVPVAECTGLILPLGDWVLQQACRQIAQWSANHIHCRVSVNVSAQQFRQPHFVQRLSELLQTWHVPSQMLELELTETMAVSNRENAAETMRQVVALGVDIALDDFGMGHSSLAYLRDLPVVRLKIDKAFVQGVTHNDQDANLVRAVIALATALDKTVVGEGVETDAQRDFLVREGCPTLQGWLYAKAVAPGEVPDVIRRIEASFRRND